MSKATRALNAAQTPEQFLAALKAAAAVVGRRRRALPPELPDDSLAVLRGEKSLLRHRGPPDAAGPAPPTSFRFSCTSCGQCCRALSSAVLVDPADAWAMAGASAALGRHLSASASASASDSSSASSLHPSPFVDRLGRFERDGLGSAAAGGRLFRRRAGAGGTEAGGTEAGGTEAGGTEAGGEDDALLLNVGPGWPAAPLRARSGLAPVLYLSPFDHRRRAKEEGIAGSVGAPAGGEADVRCCFSAPAPAPATLSAPTPSPASAAGGSTPPSPSPAARPAPLVCTLGTAGMPLACALYPLGDFWGGGGGGGGAEDGAREGDDEMMMEAGGAPSSSWYSLDSSCEGVGEGAEDDTLNRSRRRKSSTSSTTSSSGPIAPSPALRTLDEYRGTNSLALRQAGARWARRLSTAHACSGLDAMTREAAAPLSAAEAVGALRALHERAATRAGAASPPLPHDAASAGRASGDSERRGAAALSGADTGGQQLARLAHWLGPAIVEVEGHVSRLGLSLNEVSGPRAVGADDLLLRILRDRVREIWYRPSLGREQASTPADWRDVAPHLERATRDLHADWAGLVLPAIRTAAAAEAKSSEGREKGVGTRVWRGGRGRKDGGPS